MTIEEQLAEMFDVEAARAPGTDGLAEGARRRARERRRRLAALIGAGAAAAAAAVVLAGAALGGSGATLVSPSPSGTVPDGLAGSPIVVEGVSASCVYGYSPELVAEKLDFAFDGTVISVGEPVSQHPGDAEPWSYVGVAFRVDEWFKGGGPETIVVDMPESGTASAEGRAPGYATGTRLLVSGMARWGGADPLAYPVAWFGCGGFSRYYSDAIARSWRAANR